MTIKPKYLGTVKLRRQDVVGGYTEAYINAIITFKRFKNKFLSYWDGGPKTEGMGCGFSLFYDTNRVGMTKLLGMGTDYGVEDLNDSSELRSNLDEIDLIWSVKPANTNEAYRDTVMAKIETTVLDVYGYSVEMSASTCNTWDTKLVGTEFINVCTSWNYTYKVGGATLTNPFALAVYDALAHIFYKQYGIVTKQFTFAEISTALRAWIFTDTHTTFNTATGKNESKIGDAYLATYGLLTDPLSSCSTIDTTAFAALEPDEFYYFVKNNLDVAQKVHEGGWLQQNLSTILMIVGIILLIWGIGEIIMGIAQGIEYGAAAAAAGWSTTEILTVTAAGILGGTAVSSAGMLLYSMVEYLVTVYSAYSQISALGQAQQQAPESVQTPKEIETKVAIADEVRWTYTDMNNPDAYIYGVLNAGKP